MREREWSILGDEAMERLLVERWLYRGIMLAVMFGAAIVATYIGIRGMTTLADRVAVGASLVLGIGAGAVAFVMRVEDMRMHRELRRRRSGKSKA